MTDLRTMIAEGGKLVTELGRLSRVYESAIDALGIDSGLTHGMRLDKAEHCRRRVADRVDEVRRDFIARATAVRRREWGEQQAAEYAELSDVLDQVRLAVAELEAVTVPEDEHAAYALACN